MKFTLNGMEYIIEEFDDIRMDNRNRGTAYYWASEDSEGEIFPTQAEVQQDAIDHATTIFDWENRDMTEQENTHADKWAFFHERGF